VSGVNKRGIFYDTDGRFSQEIDVADYGADQQSLAGTPTRGRTRHSWTTLHNGEEDTNKRSMDCLQTRRINFQRM